MNEIDLILSDVSAIWDGVKLVVLAVFGFLILLSIVKLIKKTVFGGNPTGLSLEANVNWAGWKAQEVDSGNGYWSTVGRGELGASRGVGVAPPITGPTYQTQDTPEWED